MNLKRALAVAHLAFASLYLVFVLFGSWAKRGNPDEGVFSSDGGTGFGIVAIVLGVALVALAVMRLMGRNRVLPGFGVEQLTIGLGLAAVANLLAYTVGWLAVFPTGTGWAIPAAYFPASFIPQVGLLTLSAEEPETGIKPLDTAKMRLFSGVALLAAAGVALFPFLTWISSGNISLSGYDGRAGNPTSGPRLAYILLIVGAAVALAALMRLRPKGLAEPGPNLLHSQMLFGAGLVAFLLPLATLISILQQDLSPSLDVGIGVWLGLLAGLVLMGVAVAETRLRGAQGV